MNEQVKEQQGSLNAKLFISCPNTSIQQGIFEVGQKKEMEEEEKEWKINQGHGEKKREKEEGKEINMEIKCESNLKRACVWARGMEQENKQKHCGKRARAGVYQQLHGTTERRNQAHSHKMKEQTEKTEGMRGGQQWQAEKKRKRHCGSHSFSFSSSLSPDKIPEGNAAW